MSIAAMSDNTPCLYDDCLQSVSLTSVCHDTSSRHLGPPYVLILTVISCAFDNFRKDSTFYEQHARGFHVVWPFATIVIQARGQTNLLAEESPRPSIVTLRALHPICSKKKKKKPLAPQSCDRCHIQEASSLPPPPSFQGNVE